MLPIAYYLLKVIICSSILYGYYWLLLRNKAFHKYNRFYLMASVVLSLLLPLIKINFWQPQQEQQNGVIKVLQVVSNGDEYLDNVIVSTKSNAFDMQQLYPLVYLAVSIVFFIIFMHTLFSIFILLKKYPKQIIENISFVNTDAKSTPFSFLKYIFWNHNIDMESTTGNQIFKHELAHVQEGHTYDKLFINIILVFFWCNPFYWLYRKELNMIHEFIADKKAVEDSDTAAFAAMILQATYPQHRFQLTNNFFYSPIKRRLLMLTKNKNPTVNYFGRIMVLPLLVLIFAAFTLKTKTVPHIYQGKKFIIVVDPGHGGSDNGATSADGILEKNITLAIAKEIKSLNTNKNIEIVLTKETDVFLDSREKPAFAKLHNASLYISIHTGAMPSANDQAYGLGDPMATPSGIRVLIADDNMPYANQNKILGSVLLNEFSNNYSLPVPLQLEKTNLYTLKHNPCPSVYIEAGVMTNKEDVEYLKSSHGKEIFARNILNAIEKYALATSKDDALQNIQLVDSPPRVMYVNVKHAGENYLQSDDYKNKALVIIDGKEMGNVGNKYVEKNGINYNTITVYNNEEARKIYGETGKYGVIKLSVKDAKITTISKIAVDNNKNSLQLTAGKTVINEGINNSLIYIDGKVSTPAELNAISPDKISSINILKGEKLDAITDANGKTSVINVTLKPATLPNLTVVSVKPKPLYIIDKVIQDNDFNLNKIEPSDIERIDVLKDASAVSKYGPKGINGVVEITTKKRIQLTLQPTTQLSLQIVPDPRFSVGGLKGVRINVDEFKKQTEMAVTDGYSFASADVYFSGAGFTYVVMVHLNGSSLSPIIEYIDRCAAGSAVTFDNVYVIDSKGNKKAIEGKSYSIVGKEMNDKVFTKVEVEAGYAEGNDAWKKYLQQHLDPAIPVSEGWKAGTYTIVVQFIIHTDGSVSDVTTTNYTGTKTALHCIDLVKKSSNWLPAIQNGRAVNAYRKQPITFLITPEEEKKSITELYSLPQFQLPWLLSKNKLSKSPC